MERFAKSLTKLRSSYDPKIKGEEILYNSITKFAETLQSIENARNALVTIIQVVDLSLIDVGNGDLSYQLRERPLDSGYQGSAGMFVFESS